MLALIFMCFGIEMWLAAECCGDPRRLHSSAEIVTNQEMLYVAMGILGATVMPQSLSPSGIVQTRDVGRHDADKRDAIRLATVDSTVALATARQCFHPRLAAAAFHASGSTAIAGRRGLCAPGTAARHFAGCDAVRPGAARLRAQLDGHRDARRPDRDAGLPRAQAETLGEAPPHPRHRHHSGRRRHHSYGESATARLLIGSQVVLSLQLPFAVIPLVLFTARRRIMGNLVAPRWLTIATGIIAVDRCAHVKLLFDIHRRRAFAEVEKAVGSREEHRPRPNAYLPTA